MRRTNGLTSRGYVVPGVYPREGALHACVCFEAQASLQPWLHTGPVNAELVKLVPVTAVGRPPVKVSRLFTGFWTELDLDALPLRPSLRAVDSCSVALRGLTGNYRVRSSSLNVRLPRKLPSGGADDVPSDSPKS